MQTSQAAGTHNPSQFQRAGYRVRLHGSRSPLACGAICKLTNRLRRIHIFMFNFLVSSPLKLLFNLNKIKLCNFPYPYFDQNGTFYATFQLFITFWMCLKHSQKSIGLFSTVSVNINSAKQNTNTGPLAPFSGERCDQNAVPQYPQSSAVWLPPWRRGARHRGFVSEATVSLHNLHPAPYYFHRSRTALSDRATQH